MIKAITAVGFFTFGLTYLVKYTDGPLDTFSKLRGFLGVKQVPVLDSNEATIDYVEESNGSFLANLISCWWCTSTWVALLGTIILLGRRSILYYLLVWFGAIGFAGILHHFVEEIP